MKNKILLSTAVSVLIFVLISCSLQNETAEPDKIVNEEADETEVLDIIPFSERKFIYRNNLNYEDSYTESNEDSKTISKYYPKISGLINKAVEKKLNDEIAATVDKSINAAENYAASKSSDPEIQVSLSSHIQYNYNNVIVIDYNYSVAYNDESLSKVKYFSESRGYDLNTGSIISLKDLFKRGTDYNKILNDCIYMEIIRSNFDNPDSEYMTGPFQGIREDQNFSLNEYMLTIIMDEKNEEFNTKENPIDIDIPLTDIGEHLAIFDRYFDENENIYENERIKKLMLNLQGYSIYDGIVEYEEKYIIHVEMGRFEGIEDAETKKLLDDAVSVIYDVDGFRERANASSAKSYGSLYHNIDFFINSGGYISLYANSYKNEMDIVETHGEYVNFNLNNNKIMTMSDLFVDGFDYKAAILELTRTNEYYRIPKDTFSEDAEIIIRENNFHFYENAFIANLYQDDEHTYDMWIEYKDIGYENISIFQ